jgi:hypothetical protein
MNQLLWTKLSIHGPVPRAYHTASIMVINGCMWAVFQKMKAHSIEKYYQDGF